MIEFEKNATIRMILSNNIALKYDSLTCYYQVYCEKLLFVI